MGGRCVSGFRIRSIDVSGFPGHVGVASCPGLTAGPEHRLACRRDLERHLDAVRAWGAVAVLTLLEDLEMLEAGVGMLGAAVEARGLEWHHLPVARGHASDPRFERFWRITRLRLREHLRRGGNVLIHAGADPERASLVASRVLAEIADHPVAVLPAAQPFAGTPDDFWRRQDRIMGGLLGGAVGNALGRAIRFQPVEAGPAIDSAGRLASAMLRGGRLILSDHASMLLTALAPRRTGSAQASRPIGCSEPAPGGAHFQIGVADLDPVLAGALVGVGAVSDRAEWAGLWSDGSAAQLASAFTARAIGLLVSGATVEHAIDEARASSPENGAVPSILATATHCLLAGDTFVDSMAQAAGHQDHAAAAVAIVGCIKGAACGLSSIPHPWTSSLDTIGPLSDILNPR